MVDPTTNTSVKPVTVNCLQVYSVYLHLVAAILFLSLFLSSLYLSISEYAPAIYQWKYKAGYGGDIWYTLTTATQYYPAMQCMIISRM